MIVLKGKTHNLGDGFTVTRLLPDIRQRSVGPFLFFDYFGPVTFPPGKGIDVRPHPHIGLATVTYLFEGAQMHRDTLGSVQEIKPGDINWMTAGRGIAHSERSGDDVRAAGHKLHGIQTWVGLPQADEEAEPYFQHFSADQLPLRNEQDVEIRVMVGSAFGLTSPVKTFSPIFYADLYFGIGGSFLYTAEHEERAFFVIEGEIQTGYDIQGVVSYHPGSLVILKPALHGLSRPADPVRRREAGWAAPHLVEFRVVLERAHRTRQAGMEGRRLRADPGRRQGVHPAARRHTA